jgi:hypothetical protein
MVVDRGLNDVFAMPLLSPVGLPLGPLPVVLRARAAKQQIVNHASPAVLLRYDSKWGDFQLLWSQFLKVSPSDDFGMARLHLVGDIFLY